MDVRFIQSNCGGCPNDKGQKCPYKEAMAAQALAQGKVTTCRHKP